MTEKTNSQISLKSSSNGIAVNGIKPAAHTIELSQMNGGMNGHINKSEPFQKPRKIASPINQLGILLWKNTLLSKNNVCGLVSEIVFPIALILILLVMRYFIDRITIAEQATVAVNAMSLLPRLNTTLLLFYPNNPLIENVVKSAVNVLKISQPTFNPTIQGSNVDGTSLDSTTISNLVAMISFPSTYTSSLPDNVQYTIYTQETKNSQYNTGSVFVTKTDYMFSQSPESFCYTVKYFTLYNKFNALKAAVDMTIISNQTGVALSDPSMIKLQQYPCQSYYNDELKGRFSFLIIIIIDIVFLFTIIVNIGNIVAEKQTKMKEYLRLLGVKWYIIWLSWLVRSMIIYTIFSLLLSGIGLIPLPPRQANDTYTSKEMYTTTNYGIIFVTFFVYSIQVSTFTLLIAQIFSRPLVAKVAVILLWIITAINFYNSLAISAIKYILCLFPNIGLTFAFQVIYQFERSSKTTDMYVNIFGDSLYVGSVLATMFGFAVLYLLIAWYVERIFPGEYGQAWPFYFPFMPSYWCGESASKHEIYASSTDTNNPGFEREPGQLKPNVQIQNISKEFRFGLKKKKVVNNMSLNFYENQITGLLGHNGAGKTTTTFMLCGIYPPTSGTANILGNSIITEMDKIRTSIGYCPQHNILYEDLSVEEHLKLVAKVKGYQSTEIQEEIIRISTFVGLQNDLKTRSKGLSGGMKRRLSVAMALIGDSKVIILDEPTSGLDPYNRRMLWELIRKYKNGRTIILTTHFMEEADALSDRIAIMNHGEVKCCGSPLFLKNTFGSGYKLTVSKQPNFKEIEFLDKLSKQINNYSVETNIAGEMSLALPYDQSNKLSALLEDLEKTKTNLGFSSYGISSSTIEEVFLKVGQIDKNGEVVDEKEMGITESVEEVITEKNDLNNAFNNDAIAKTGIALWFQQLGCLLRKRFFIFTRRYILAIMTLFLPLLLQLIIAFAIPKGTNLVNEIGNTTTNPTSYTLDITKYNPQTLPYYLFGSVSTSSVESLISSYFKTGNKTSITLEKLNNNSVATYVLQKRKDDIKNLVSNYYVGMSLNLSSATGLYATGFYSTLAYHSSASILNEISNFLLAFYNSNSLSKTISTTNAPLSADDSRSAGNYLSYLPCIDSFPQTLLNFFDSIIIALIIGLFVVHVGIEKANGSKSLQLLSGTHYGVYWLANHLFDFAICLFNVGALVGILKLVDYIRNDATIEIHPIAASSTIGYFFVLLLISSLSWTTLAYIWSFIFKSEIIGFVVLAIILGLAGFTEMILSFLELLVQSDTSNPTLNSALYGLLEALRWIVAFLCPNVTIKRAIFDLKVRENSYCISSLNTLLNVSYTEGQEPFSMSEHGIGIMLVISALQFVIGNVILILLEARPTIKKCKKSAAIANHEITSDDKVEDDVEAEIKRIELADTKTLSQQEPLVVNDLLMKFQKKKQDFIAVNHLCFGVEKKNCFGLLGVNGAGKTTTFKILTGELKATSGNAFINGFDINRDHSNAIKSLGFCPQFDYLPDYLTVKQALKLFADLRGLDKESSNLAVDDLMKIFKLEEFTDKLVQNLSGGNKRKVSAAIAFLGKPSVVILDEPTTGMDPGARRYLWAVISKARDQGMTIVLTSHSMEECEALCTKLGIMVNGQLQCLGNIQHLKSKYGKGYSLVIKSNHGEKYQDYIRNIKDFVQRSIKSAQLKDEQQETLYYQIDHENEAQSERQSLSQLFSLVEKNKDSLNIETYSLSQTTLEDVFLSFVRLQKNLEDNQ